MSIKTYRLRNECKNKISKLFTIKDKHSNNNQYPQTEKSEISIK